MSPHRRSALTAAAIVTVALLLRVFRIGDQELWFDEAFSFHMATIPTGLWEALRIENSPPLHYLFLRAWAWVAGTSEVALRLPSAAFGALGVALTIAAGRRLFNWRVGLWAGAVMAVSPIHIYYSQEARSYTTVICLLLLTYLLLLRALDHSSPGRWTATGLAGLAAIYTHYWAILGLLPSVLLLRVWPSPYPMRDRLLGYAAAASLIAACVVPWVIWSFVLISHPFSVGPSMVRVWEQIPPALAIPKSLELFGIGHQADTYPNVVKVYPSLQFPTSLRLVGIGLFVLLAVWTIVPWGDRRLEIPDIGRRKTLLWSWLAIAVGGMWIVSMFRPTSMVGRHDLVALPAFMLLVGFALAKLQALPGKASLLASVAALGIFVVVGLKLFLYYQIAASHPPEPSYRQTAAVLVSQAQTGDMVTFNSIHGTPLLYYLHRLGYRWEQRECRNPGTGRHFGCRIFLPDEEVEYGLPDDPSSLSSFARMLRFSLKGPDNVLWVVADGAFISDRVFLAELAALDLVGDRVPISNGVPLFAFRPHDALRSTIGIAGS